MIFGEMPVDKAVGAILAHSVAYGEGVFKKGKLLSAGDVLLLRKANVAKVFAASLEADDVPEDMAAHQLAGKLGGENLAVQQPFTGRANLYAGQAGIIVIDEQRVKALNRIHESITLATLSPNTLVSPRQMVATVKIIPFAVKASILREALAVIGSAPLMTLHPLTPHSVGLVISKTHRTKPSIVQKSESAMRERIEALGSSISDVIICAHEIEAIRDSVAKLQKAKCSPILVFGASAIVDRGDVVPAGVVAAGGTVLHLGMPVDPGNLMMLASIDDVPVIGVPSCARSPKVNGFDWVLERVLAGMNVTAQDVMDMGAGGLLAEISSRPTPREGTAQAHHAPRITAVVLAAGKSTRMGSNKLLAELDGKPLIQHTVESLRASSVDAIVIVTGNEPAAMRQALNGLDVKFVHNPQFADGLSTSLKCGLGQLGSEVDGAMICLGDMPLVDATSVDRLVASFSVADHRTICVPTHDGKRGNPVLWGKQHFTGLREITGDQGGRLLMQSLSDEIVEVEMASPGVLVDVDTPEALSALRSVSAP